MVQKFFLKLMKKEITELTLIHTKKEAIDKADKQLSQAITEALESIFNNGRAL